MLKKNRLFVLVNDYFKSMITSIDLHFFSCRYPTTSEYVQVVKMLIAKYPFMKDLEGNGYVSALANNYTQYF